MIDSFQSFGGSVGCTPVIAGAVVTPLEAGVNGIVGRVPGCWGCGGLGAKGTFGSWNRIFLLPLLSPVTPVSFTGEFHRGFLRAPEHIFASISGKRYEIILCFVPAGHGCSFYSIGVEFRIYREPCQAYCINSCLRAFERFWQEVCS